ncbi:hypothetical protein [Hymenobacter sp. B81]|uniref:hypothetical protein n=1 Tax=Hymenobacter sp. B81 TaxID=3344878 RepID=UPI0037DC1658
MKRTFHWFFWPLLALLLLLHTEYSEPLLLVFPLGGALVLGGVYLGWHFSLRSFPTTAKSILRAMMAAGVLSYPLMIPIWDWQNDATRRRAEVIIQSLEAYEKQRGRYPDSLAQLVPRYLPIVPPTARSLSGWDQYNYRLIPDFTQPYKEPTDAYWLSYSVGLWVTAEYDSNTRQWRAD